MSIEQNIENLEIRNANVVTFVGSSSTIVDTISGRIQCKGFQHNSNVITDISGPHGRVAPTLKKYPEIIFADGKFDRNDTTNTYVQAGYTVTASSQANDEKNAATLYDDKSSAVGGSSAGDTGWQGLNGAYVSSGDATSIDTLTGITGATSTRDGSYTTIELPHKIKVSRIQLHTRNSTDHANPGHPKQIYVYGSNDGSSWTQIGSHLFTATPSRSIWQKIDINSTTPYNYFALQATSILDTTGRISLLDLEWYGYEEDPPAGDHSVDTTFKSRFNNPQLTGVQVFVDGKGSGSNQISGGPDVTGTTTYNESGKHWELNGQLTSNITMEANTFLEGDQPHAVSVWFNSSNLEANTANTCVFSISDQEKLDSVNLDLQSNTWHNLTYAYQGEGGSRVTYLDGRKVAEDQAEDTFGDYPPFAMTGHSQGGYVVSAVEEYDVPGGGNPNYRAWEAFDNDTNTGSGTGYWSSKPAAFAVNNGVFETLRSGGAFVTNVGGTNRTGVWLQLELPHKLKVAYITWQPRSGDGMPRTGFVAGSNNGVTWEQIYEFMSVTGTTGQQNPILASGNISQIAYKYIRIITTNGNGNQYISAQQVRIYGHRENDLVRLPDPTNVLKYPHIAMTGPAQRGYALEVSSSHTSTSFAGYQAEQKGYLFDGDASTFWHCNTNGTSDHQYNGNNSSYGTNSVANFDQTGINVKGEWIQLKFPHKLKISKVHLLARSNQEAQAPEDFAFYGSDTGSAGSWTLIQAFTGESPQDDGSSYYDITSNPAPYKYILMLMTRLVSSTGAVSLAGLQYYGTGVDSIPIQIGGGNIDKVANFRVYDKFIGEDQALEIWDAQKDEFGRAKPQMVLQQGKLGIGTDAPQGSLSVADEPDPTTYGFQEFPPKPLAGNKTFFEGHGEFCVSASSIQSVGRSGWTAFNKGHMSTSTSVGWISGYDPITYNSSGVATGSFGVINGVNGEYLILESPYKIKMDHVLIYPRAHVSTTASYSLPPKDGKIWGRNVIDEPWTEITSYTNLTYGATRADNLYGQIPTRVNINATQYYKYIAFQITATNVSYQHVYTDYTNIKELRYFGYREQLPPKQSVLHDGQLTLTKSLTVPRIGPALDADDTPRRDRLVAEYNTSTNPTFDGAVRDTSGRGNDIIMHGNAKYDASEKAFRLDGTSGTYMSGTQTLGTGTPAHTITGWFKQVVSLTNWTYVMFIGTSGSGTQSGMLISNTGQIVFDIYNTRIDTTVDASTGIWHHFAGVFKGGTSVWDNASTDLYINGQLEGSAAPDSGTQYSFNLTGNGIQFGSSTNFVRYFNGLISNFKLYDAALTAEEVKTLYDMGRCDEGHHVVNFSKTRVGIGLGDGEAPRSALDVRDPIYARTTTIGTFTGQHICFPDESMEKGLIVSAKKNKFVKLNGLATGKSAITIDESLPIVSLSNVAQDKACFGVVSKMEESNAAYRTEITGGLVSESVKIAGDNRAIVNSVGEGAIWVVNTGGSLESGDYITTSNVAGYGQKQDGAGLMNYTVAKITMDCDFTASNVAVQTIKREETGLQTIMEDTWNQLVDYDRSSNTETQYSNTLVSSDYSGQSGYTPREVTTIMDYTDGSNLISTAEWSNLESNIQNTYQSNTFTEIVDYTKFVNLSEWSNLTAETQATYSEAEITTYYQIQRGGNVLDENGQLQWEDKTGATEAPYEKRFLTVDGTQTDEANAVHIAAFVGCTYHCG